MKYLIAGLVLCAAFLAGAQDIGKETRVDSVLASVNGEPITLLDVMLESGREEMRLASLFSGARLYTEIAKLRKNVIEEIITRKLVYAQYTARPFPIENQYIETIIDMLAITMGGGTRDGLVKKAKELGTTMNELRQKAKEKIAVDVLLSEYCDRPIFTTPKDVYDYYVSNPKEWTTPTRYELELLQIARNGGRSGPDPKIACQKLSEQMAKADKALFYQLVKANSDAPNSDNGGNVGQIDEDKLRPEFAPVVKKLKPGMIAGPVETPEGFYFIRLAATFPEEKIPFEKASEEIRKRLDLKAKSELRKAYSEKIKKQALIRYYF
ncbi:MAG: putative parvulin-type peptidyl-prolyl cis-trans isomerase precursor [Lentisphaerae bacterium ADurb.Bin242]|nr:MAG: putative parvulin-type peptidyl-prolyl cis-trans isomerase precursor [Lentisphaerae bacterium ADurb.Bin242]